ncbi:MAG: anthranilate synthase component II [Bacillaceae bacterium]
MILLIDNYDSFTYNLYQLLASYDDVTVIRNDSPLLQGDLTEYSVIVVSPGPGTPKEAGYVIEVIQRYSGFIPILGICLGHQSIVEAYGGQITHAKTIKHGKTSTITHNQDSLFYEIPSSIQVMRYHSLIATREELPNCLDILAVSEDDNEIMAIKHREYEVYGVQFHPESFLTAYGSVLIRNFIEGVYKDAKRINKISSSTTVK